MPDWVTLDPQLRQFAAEGVSPTAMAKRLNLARQTVVDRLRALGLKDPPQSKPATGHPKAPPLHIEFPLPPTSAVEVLPGQLSIEDADTAPVETVSTSADIVPGAGVSTSVDIVPVNDVSASLSPNEIQTFEHYEQIIAKGIKTFVEVGHALLTIRERKLYREAYTTFEDYCRQRWDLSRPRAYQLIDAAQVIDTVSTIVDIVPANEAQARPLTSLPPEQQREVWREAVDTAPPSGITAKHVQQTVKRATGKTTAPKPQTPAPPEPKRPARMVVQEGLVWGLREITDDDAWRPLVRLWDDLNDVAPKYESLCGMLARVARHVPEEHRALIELAQEKASE